MSRILSLVPWRRRGSSKASPHPGSLDPSIKVLEEAGEEVGVGEETQSLLWPAKGPGGREASLGGCFLSLSSVTNLEPT